MDLVAKDLPRMWEAEESRSLEFEASLVHKGQDRLLGRETLS